MARKAKSVYERIEEKLQEIKETEKLLATQNNELQTLYLEKDDLEMRQLLEMMKSKGLTIADIISIETMLDICQFKITDDMIKRLYSQMQYGNPDAKKAASMLIAYVMLKNEEDIAKRYTYFSKNTVRMMELVADKLSVQPFFEITPESLQS